MGLSRRRSDAARPLTFLRAGVREYKTDLETQKVNVTADPSVDLESVLAVIKKTGKEVVSSHEVEA